MSHCWLLQGIVPGKRRCMNDPYLAIGACRRWKQPMDRLPKMNELEFNRTHTLCAVEMCVH